MSANFAVVFFLNHTVDVVPGNAFLSDPEVDRKAKVMFIGSKQPCEVKAPLVTQEGEFDEEAFETSPPQGSQSPPHSSPQRSPSQQDFQSEVRRLRNLENKVPTPFFEHEKFALSKHATDVMIYEV
ncbi:hypothetical protein OESDEN_03768 [Oesophagostomum dentatum]|uniref:Uncharacterized protein n=1 Tax=Oesophagostomum dentatum TaxID=61180 RepID=A0A0B1TLI8_OESDE|nr:hypothetical protein OESDEN_03768 [Oesophagostomum dentatum]